MRAIILNRNGKAQAINHHFSVKPLSGSQTSNDQFWVFYPDGTFGHASSLASQYHIADAYIKISIIDTASDTEAAKKAHASIVLIDPSGYAEVCSKTDSRELCQYSENE